MNFRYLNAMIFLMVCLSAQPVQAMDRKEELGGLNTLIAKYERKLRMKGRLSEKEAANLKGARDRKYELEVIHGLTSAEVPRAQQRQAQLRARRQQEEVQQPSGAAQSELRLQASVQTLQPGERPQPLQQAGQQPQRAQQSRVQHAQSQQNLQPAQDERQSREQDSSSQDDQSWNEHIKQQVDNLFVKDEMQE